MLAVLLNPNLTLDEAMSFVDRGKQEYRKHQQWEADLLAKEEAQWKEREAEIEAEYLANLEREKQLKAAGVETRWRLTAQLDAINMMMWLF